MLVSCERCRSQFKLEESVLADGGARVRCPRCQHSFFVTSTGAADSDPAHAVASEALDLSGPAEAEVEEEIGVRGEFTLDDASDDYAVVPKPVASAASIPREPEPHEEESDWQFNDGPAAPRPSVAAPETRGAPRRTLEDFIEPHSDDRQASLDALGSPDSWDLLVGRERAARGTSRGASANPTVSESANGRATPSVSTTRVSHAARAVPDISLAGESQRRASVPRAQRPRAPEVAGWTVCAGLLLLTLHGILFPPAAVRRAPPAAVVVAGLEVADVRGRVVENALGGGLFVVSGRLRNPGGSPLVTGSTVDVVLLGETGEPLDGQRAPAGGAVDEAKLREEAPETLAAEIARSAHGLAWLPLAPGDSVAFDAVFERLPAETTGIGLESSPAPAPLSEPAAPAEAAPEVQPSAQEQPATTDASRPSSLPSSG